METHTNAHVHTEVLSHPTSYLYPHTGLPRPREAGWHQLDLLRMLLHWLSTGKTLAQTCQSEEEILALKCST